MKFLCVKCDEPMTLGDVKPYEDGTVGLGFACGKCSHEIAMLANPMEAQLVKSLGVHVGGRKGPRKPMEAIRSSLLMPGGDKDGEAGSVIWEKAAEERLSRVPDMARHMARSAIERYAMEKGYATITTDVMDEAKKLHG